MYEDDPAGRVFDLLGEAIFGDHPLGRARDRPRRGGRARSTREQLRAFHAERYRPANVVIAAAGIGRPRARSSSWRAAGRSRAAPARPRAARPSPPPSPDIARRCASSRRTPSSTTSASAGPASRATTSAASRCACSKACSAAPPPRASSRRCASAAASPTRCSAFSSLYAHAGEIGLYVGHAAGQVARGVEVIADELARCAPIQRARRSWTRSRENLKGRVVLALESTGARMSGSVLGAHGDADPGGRRGRSSASTPSTSPPSASSPPSCSLPERCRSPQSAPTEEAFRSAIAPLAPELAGRRDPRRRSPARPGAWAQTVCGAVEGARTCELAARGSRCSA